MYLLHSSQGLSSFEITFYNLSVLNNFKLPISKVTQVEQEQRLKNRKKYFSCIVAFSNFCLKLGSLKFVFYT